MITAESLTLFLRGRKGASEHNHNSEEIHLGNCTREHNGPNGSQHAPQLLCAISFCQSSLDTPPCPVLGPRTADPIPEYWCSLGFWALPVNVSHPTSSWEERPRPGLTNFLTRNTTTALLSFSQMPPTHSTIVPQASILSSSKLNRIKICLASGFHPPSLSHSPATYMPQPYPTLRHIPYLSSWLHHAPRGHACPYFSTQSSGGWRTHKWNSPTLGVQMDQGACGLQPFISTS